jgi:hypothetical protein
MTDEQFSKWYWYSSVTKEQFMKENCESACEVDSEYFSWCSEKNPLYPS